MVVTAVGEEPEPSKADLLKTLRLFEEQVMAGFAELRAAIAGPAEARPETIPDGLDDLPPMRRFMLDDEDDQR